MLIGVPKEIKNHEYRIGLTPSGARELIANGHKVMVQRDGGKSIGLTNEQYEKAGAEIVDSAEEIFKRAEMIIKVKEPQPVECAMLRPGQILYTYLHLAPDPEQTKALVASGCTAIAYETVTDRKGGLPLLAPMSEVAGRMSIQAGAHALEKAQGGSGVLLGGVPGVKPAEVLVIGGGVVGINAARMAMGMGAHVTILDRSLDRLKYLDELYGDRITTIYSTHDAIEERLPDTDLVIGAVLIPGAAAPKLVSREQLKLMRPGSVLMPGLINAHTHNPMSLMRGVADDLALMPWLNEHIWPIERAVMTPDFIADGIELAVAEMIRGGTTCCNENYFFPDAQARTYDRLGFRAAISIPVIDFPSAWASSQDEYFDKGLAVHDQYRSHPLLSFSMTPHAPYTVCDASFERIRRYAEQLDLPVHCHIHETAQEITDSIRQYGQRPLARA
ncbi:MAG: alanine dehydrogenase [Pseudomonadota bacterium]